MDKTCANTVQTSANETEKSRIRCTCAENTKHTCKFGSETAKCEQNTYNVDTLSKHKKWGSIQTCWGHKSRPEEWKVSKFNPRKTVLDISQLVGCCKWIVRRSENNNEERRCIEYTERIWKREHQRVSSYYTTHKRKLTVSARTQILVDMHSKVCGLILKQNDRQNS